MRSEYTPLPFERKEEVSTEYPSLTSVATLLQVRLISMAFQERYAMKPGEASAEIRNIFSAAWIAANASAFREYVEKHPDETIDINDEEVLLRFIEKALPLVTVH